MSSEFAHSSLRKRSRRKSRRKSRKRWGKRRRGGRDGVERGRGITKYGSIRKYRKNK